MPIKPILSLVERASPIVSCPHCGIEHQWDTNNRFRPFCSERCKMIDLGKWASEDYRVAQPDGHGEYANSDDEHARLSLT
ncbi:MAG: DNA gyrase inhibitor YacG [Gallionella sp.]|nr:DNA gyrase inhibitor YacG [Gallionella sp.]